jgi:predicted TIM-barrel fold metal-dependent hydrolase
VTEPGYLRVHRVPLIDDHAHPFGLTADVFDLAGISLDVGEGADADARRREVAPGRLALEALQVRLAGLLGCAVADLLQARAAAAVDWPSYLRLLFADVGLAGMVLDGGPHPVRSADLAAYRDISGGLGMWSLLRLESVIDPLLAAGGSADEVLDAVQDAIAQAAAAGSVGCKTVLAYRTGLAVDPAASLAEARRSVTDSAALPVRRQAKALRDLVLRRSLAQCADLGLAMQVHTGFGDSEIRLRDADPIGLDDLLRTPEAESAKVVLIHAAYPWHEQVAYLSAVRASVWAEFSLVNLFAPATSADRLLRLIDLAPTGRILIGSDGHGTPETHWFALSVLRDAWTEVARRLGPLARASWLDDAERAIFSDNARAVYQLHLP